MDIKDLIVHQQQKVADLLIDVAVSPSDVTILNDSDWMQIQCICTASRIPFDLTVKNIQKWVTQHAHIGLMLIHCSDIFTK